ncbi:pantothenate kinase 2-like [Magnolia sinica]|uniref:pantothenate kinase 2-like n=1 Tax=Magnolia sinica TaxID=86752 RepID=UPI0026582BAD|nr:pantothenate kinase 2-like [Magnolia sinica]
MAQNSNSTNKHQLDFNGAKIQETPEEQNPSILLPNQPTNIQLFSLDIGGSLIKLAYFSRDEELLNDGDQRDHPVLGGVLRFVKFERNHLDECLDFIQSRLLGKGMVESSVENARIRATGGGAYAFGDIFKERLDVTVENVDELDSVVSGANFLLQNVPNEAYRRSERRSAFISIDRNDLFPYLLVIVGTSVALNMVTGDGEFKLITGTNLGGGTISGLARFLTGCESFDDFIELSQKGDSHALDLTIGDIYGGIGYPKVDFPSTTVAASFGKVGFKSKLYDYKAEDIAASLSNSFTCNITHISYLVAKLTGVRRIIFGGSYIRGVASVMDNISNLIGHWSQGQVQAIFFRHEGFLGAIGALLVNGNLKFVKTSIHNFTKEVNE